MVSTGSNQPEGPPGYGDLGGEFARNMHVKHTEQLEAGKAQPFVRLVVESRAKTPKHRPFFVTGDTIRGAVEVQHELIKQAKEVSIMVSASVTAVGQEECKFLHLSQILWSDKENMAAGKTPAGWRTFPFSITLPAEISQADKAGAASPTSFPLPPSFSEKGSPTYIDYKVIATVRRGLFKSNQTLVCPFVYLPVSRAEPLTGLREAAYRDGTALIGPDGDSEGWQISPPTQLRGTLFDNRQVVVEYTLAVARPLTHARGSPIPLSVTVTSDDEQALDLLSTPASMRAHLVRSRSVGSSATLAGTSLVRSDQVFQDSVGTAYFWTPDAGGTAGSDSRTVRGELLVRPESKPSFVCPGFSLGYAIDLLPPQAAGFVPKARPSEVLVTQGIIVTTVGADGVRIPSHAPPGYVFPDEADYTRSLGYLENGNQRFLHHGMGGTFSIG